MIGSNKYLRTTYGNTITVSKEGGDFEYIKDAVDSITDASLTNPYSIQVHPGVYLEDNPIQGKANISVIGIGGENSVTVVAENANENLFTGANRFFLENLIIKNVSGAGKYGFVMTVAGDCLLKDILFEDCINGIYLNNASAQMIARNTTFSTSNTTTGMLVEAGNLTADNTIVFGTSTIGSVLKITGANSITTINGLVSFSPNVTKCIYVQDAARVVAAASSIVGMVDGVVLDGGSNFRATAITCFNAQQDALRVDDVGSYTEMSCQGCTFESATRFNLNMLSSTSIATGSGLVGIDKVNYVVGARVYGVLIDTKEDDEGVNILGELHVGVPENGAESVFGEGDSYTRGMLVYTENTDNEFVDVSAAARSASSSTFTFTGVAADNAIYIASFLQNSSDYLHHFGIKTKTETACVKGTGEIIIEYWNGTSWTEVNGMEVDSGDGYYPHAKGYFENLGSHHIRYDKLLSIDNWTKNDPMSLGTSYFWVRFRIVTAITTAPVFQQFKLHTNRFEVNEDGFFEFFGKARPIAQLPFSIGQDKAFDGNLGNVALYINEDIGSGFIENNFNISSDKIGRFFFVPLELDTSSPIQLKIAGRPSANGTAEFTVRWGKVTDGDTIYTSDPGALPGGKSVTVSKSTTAGELTFYDFDLDVSDVIAIRENGQPDVIGLSIHSSTLTTTDFALMAIEANFVKWCSGGHV